MNDLANIIGIGTYNIPERIRFIRNKVGKNQHEFSLSMKLKPQRISNIERGASPPTVEVIEKICEKYEITYEWLMTGQGGMKKEESEHIQLLKAEIHNLKEDHKNLNEALKTHKEVINAHNATISFQRKIIDKLTDEK
jgi:transcriptional regulator with XRE-family HTH domain|tara:strand:+ start:297 stop:710 length:414 start_codon:yes stop_codon:yes gene_type:complete